MEFEGPGSSSGAGKRIFQGWNKCPAELKYSGKRKVWAPRGLWPRACSPAMGKSGGGAHGSFLSYLSLYGSVIPRALPWAIFGAADGVLLPCSLALLPPPRFRRHRAPILLFRGAAWAAYIGSDDVPPWAPPFFVSLADLKRGA